MAVLQLSTHLSQAKGQSTPALNLAIHIIPDALVRTQQAIKLNLDTATACAPDTRQEDRQGAPPSQQKPFPKAIAAEQVTGS